MEKPLNVNDHSVKAWNAIYRRDYIEKYSITFPTECTLSSEDIIFTAKATYYSKRSIPVVGTNYHYTMWEGSGTTSRPELLKDLLIGNSMTIEFINSVDYENKEDYLTAFKRCIWRYDIVFKTDLKHEGFTQQMQHELFRQFVENYKTCKYPSEFREKYYEAYFEYMDFDLFEDYLEYAKKENKRR